MDDMNVTMDQTQDGTTTTGGFWPTLLITLLIGGAGYAIGKGIECGFRAVGNLVANSKAAQQLPARHVEDETAE